MSAILLHLLPVMESPQNILLLQKNVAKNIAEERIAEPEKKE